MTELPTSEIDANFRHAERNIKDRLLQLHLSYKSSLIIRSELAPRYDVKEAIIAGAETIRDFMLLEIKKEDPQEWLVKQYRSLGLDLIPQSSNAAGSQVRVRKGESSCVGAHTICMPDRSVESRRQIIEAFLKNGYISGSESIKIHEISHCFNAHGLSYSPEISRGLRSQIVGLISNLLYAPHSGMDVVLQESHSMWTQSILTFQLRFGPSTERMEETWIDFDELPTFPMSHPDVSGQGQDVTKVAEMCKKTYENFLRMLSLGESLGEIGTFIGKSRNLITAFTDKNFSVWQDYIVRRATELGITPQGLETNEALHLIDLQTPDTIKNLEFQTYLGRLALTRAILTYLIQENSDIMTDLKRKGLEEDINRTLASSSTTTTPPTGISR